MGLCSLDLSSRNFWGLAHKSNTGGVEANGEANLIGAKRAAAKAAAYGQRRKV